MAFQVNSKFVRFRWTGATITLNPTNAPWLSNVLLLVGHSTPGSNGINGRVQYKGSFGGAAPGGALTQLAQNGDYEMNSGAFAGWTLPNAVPLPVLTEGSTPVAAPTITSFTPTTGPTGTSLTITGTNLTGTYAVVVNNVVATGLTGNTATSITATVPSIGTTGAVKVFTAGGVATSSGSFTVTVPLPQLATPTGYSATSPSATNLSQTLSAVANATGYTWEIATNSGFTVGLQTFSGSATTRNWSGLAAATYYTRVKATASGYQDSLYSTVQQVVVAAVPGVFGNLAVVDDVASFDMADGTVATDYSVQANPQILLAEVMPAAPVPDSNDTADTLRFDSPFGPANMEAKVNGGAVQPYLDVFTNAGSISIGDVNRAEGYYQVRVKADAVEGRSASAWASSPAFTQLVAGPYAPPARTPAFLEADYATGNTTLANGTIATFPGKYGTSTWETLFSSSVGASLIPNAIGALPALQFVGAATLKTLLTGVGTDYYVQFVGKLNTGAGFSSWMFGDGLNPPKNFLTRQGTALSTGDGYIVYAPPLDTVFRCEVWRQDARIRLWVTWPGQLRELIIDAATSGGDFEQAVLCGPAEGTAGWNGLVALFSVIPDATPAEVDAEVAYTDGKYPLA